MLNIYYRVRAFTSLSCQRFFLVLGIAAFTSFSLQAQEETYSWHNVAIGGGGFVSAIITSKSEQNLVYARTDVGGAYRWDQLNERWLPLLDWVNSDELGFLGVESIAIDPVETNKVYMLAGTSYFNSGKTAILISDDYGRTFTTRIVTSQFKAHGNGMGRQTGEKLAVDPNSRNVIYCGTRANGLFRSTDAGLNWTRLSSLDVTTTPNENGISFVVVDPSGAAPGEASKTIIVGVSRSGSSNLYRSNDGGATFHAVANAPSTFMPHRAVLANDGTLYVTYGNGAGPHGHWAVPEPMDNGEVWKYNLGSETFTNITPSVMARAFGGVSVDPDDPERVVVSTINTYMQQDDSWGDRIFLTTDGGTSWVDVVARGFERDEDGKTWIEGHAIHWAGSIEFDPFATDAVWVTSGNGVFRTNDINAVPGVWKFTVDGLEETVPLDIVSVPNGPLVSVIGDYDGFLHTDVSQYAPIHKPQMGTTTGLAVAGLNNDVMARTGAKLFHSTDGGVSWTETAAMGIKGSLALSADGSTMLHNPENSTITYRSTDKGQNWSVVNGLTFSNARPVADQVNPDYFYAYNPATGQFLVSEDKGENFSPSSSAGSSGSKIIRTSPYHDGDIWIPLNGGGLSRSKDRGETFAKIPGVTFCGAVGFGKEAPDKSYPAIYIWGRVGGILGIYRSIDEGQSWLRVNDDAHEYGGPGNGQFVIGDMNVFGRVYMSTVGRGIVYGESDMHCIPAHTSAEIIHNGEEQAGSFVEVEEGSDVTLSVTSPSAGTWAWTGPPGFSATTSEVALTDLSFSEGGLYYATFRDQNDCESAPQVFRVEVAQQIVSVEDDPLDFFDIYPIPAKDHINFGNINRIGELSLTDMRGRKLLVSGNSDRQIDMENFPPGIYILKIKDVQGKLYQVKIVKE